MPRYEYKVLPAPARGTKAKGVKGAEARFALAVEEMLNLQAAEGWEYQRAEILPSVERAGLTGSTTEWRNMLIFRRALEEDVDGVVLPTTAVPQPQPVLPSEHDLIPDAPSPEPEPDPEAEPEPAVPQTEDELRSAATASLSPPEEEEDQPENRSDTPR